VGFPTRKARRWAANPAPAGEKLTRLAPDFERRIVRHTTFTPRHMGTMFGAPGGDYCHGLIHLEQMGPNRPGPKRYVGQPIPIDGLYLAVRGAAVPESPSYRATTPPRRYSTSKP
jgi:phytoene dehydrogenase-like protein